MCYDYHGYAPYDPVTGYNSPLYPTDWDKQIVLTEGNVVCRFTYREILYYINICIFCTTLKLHIMTLSSLSV